jgi:ABC-type molybdenum transport system ATPase subunit/photorepair protein PhrA
MKKLKHSKYKNTGILFEMLVRKLTSETLTSNKSVTIDIIKKYFGRNTELSKELQLYNSLIKEQFRSEAQALDYVRTVKAAYDKLNQSVLKRQRYNLVKEISEKFVFTDMAKMHINNYKVLASINMIFEHTKQIIQNS